MIPLEKVKIIISSYQNLEKELATPYQASDPDWGPSIKY